eukprot:COSAG05_NODE_1392_length_4998_cov_9.918147_4_plen_89_part_00
MANNLSCFSLSFVQLAYFRLGTHYPSPAAASDSTTAPPSRATESPAMLRYLPTLSLSLSLTLYMPPNTALWRQMAGPYSSYCCFVWTF